MEISIVNLTEAIAALEKKGLNAEAAGIRATNAVALELEGDVKENLSRVQNSGGGGHIGPSGGFPNRRTGALASSIHIVPRIGLGNYTFEVGPSMVYGRILELGWANGVNYPYMKPSADALRPRAKTIFTQAFARYWKG